MLPTPESLEGKPVPHVVFKARPNDQWKDISSDDLFKGKTVVLFSLPGAYTPTCSSTHLPRYNELAPVFRQNGVDDIICVSVNDAFVMKAWGESQSVLGDILMLGDGNGDFTKALGLEMDASKFGMGVRSQRYSMIVEDGVVKELNVEAPGEFKVSAADYMLAQL